MNKLKDYRIACAVMVLLILISVFFGSRSSINKLINSAEDIFYNGIQGDGIGVHYDIEVNKGIAANVLTVTARYPTAESQKLVQQLEEDLALLDKARTPAEMYEGNRKITETAKELCEAVLKMDVEERDYDYCIKLPIDMQENNHRMRRDPYNDAARTVNEKLSAFPANLLKKLVGAEDMLVCQ